MGTTNLDINQLKDGTDGELITWDSAGAPDTVAVGTADQVLTSNGVGAAPTFQDAGGGANAGDFTIIIPGYNEARWEDVGQSNALLSDNTRGLKLYTGNQADARRRFSFDTGTDSFLAKYNPRVEILIDMGTLNNSNGAADMFVGIGAFGNSWSGDSEILFNSVNHIGFKFPKASAGSCTLYATNGDGAGSDSTSLATLQNDDTVRLVFEFDGTTASFYYAVNGDALSSVTEHTTNVPSTTAAIHDFQLVATKQNIANNPMDLYFKSGTIKCTIT